MTEFPFAVGDVLAGDFWPEPVRVVAIHPIGDGVKIEAVGIEHRQFYERCLDPSDVARVRRVTLQQRDFAGNAEAFFLAVEAQRIRNAHQFDPLLAVNISQVDPLPHQIEAVYHVMLKRSPLRFLLADDPGAGKTIMTGLLLKELKYRGLVERTLIVVPGHLKDQWLREMKERFGETFAIADRSMVNANWGHNIWNDQPQLITSMDFAKQKEVRDILETVHWDLVIVDEAHKLAAWSYGRDIKKTDRYRLGEVLSRTSAFLLFLTATPHRGDTENFRLFLDLLQPGMFATAELLGESLQNRDNPLLLRRLKEDLKDFHGRPLFPPRRVVTRIYRLNDAEKQLYNEVTAYVEQYYNKALTTDKRNVAFALLILQRRMASSVRAVRRSLERRKKRLEELLQIGTWMAEGGQFDEDALEDAPEAERLAKEQELLERLTAAETREELQAEIEKLDKLIALARQAERGEIETKLNELRAVISDERIQQTGEKMLVFTESKDTLDYLAEKLRAWGYSVVTLHGGMNLDDRIRSEHDFRHNAQVMISTEAGGEGINLQFCSLMVNYDLPWNPNRLEQRMGRIHRYGQQKQVHIYNLVARDTREGMVLTALFDKLERIREAYGTDRVFDVVGQVLAGRSLKDLIVDAIANRRSMDEIVRDIEAVPDKDAIEKVRQASLEALATRHIDLTRILGEDRRAREQRLVPEYIESFVQRACTYLDVTIQQRTDGFWRIASIPSWLRNVPKDFEHRYGPVHSAYTKIAFDKTAARRAQAEFVAPGHPLLEAIVEHISNHCSADLQRGATFADPGGRYDGLLWFVLGEIRDGWDRIAGRRLFCLYQPADGSPITALDSSVLWDLKPTDNPMPQPTTASEDELTSFVLDRLLLPYREQLLQQRQREAEIIRKYGLRSLDQAIAESESKLLDYETRRAKGESLPDVELNNEQHRKQKLLARKEALEKDIRLRTSLLRIPPTILGVARVVPDEVPTPEMRSDAEIEAVGMRVAMDYERQQGRTPLDVSKENLGYDIRSTAPDGSVRYIEVKARATTGSIALTPNEWYMAQRFGDEYWLYVVEHAATTPQLYTIENPSQNLQAQPVFDLVRYVVTDWKETSRPSS
ncbi:MAG: helicase-related protein [Chlorobi bacterium]|nr:helicase-related protein [Chlorobiota bacterium]